MKWQLVGRPQWKGYFLKEATGLGITEFTLRVMAWLCTVSETQVARNCQMCVATGQISRLLLN
jgi:hypothetical protein